MWRIWRSFHTWTERMLWKFYESTVALSILFQKTSAVSLLNSKACKFNKVFFRTHFLAFGFCFVNSTRKILNSLYVFMKRKLSNQNHLYNQTKQRIKIHWHINPKILNKIKLSVYLAKLRTSNCPKQNNEILHFLLLIISFSSHKFFNILKKVYFFSRGHICQNNKNWEMRRPCRWVYFPRTTLRHIDIWREKLACLESKCGAKPSTKFVGCTFHGKIPGISIDLIEEGEKEITVYFPNMLKLKYE